MTRTKTAGTSMGNIARARIANRADAALFLRIHADGSTDPAARGTHTLHPGARTGWTDDVYAESKRAARIVQRDLRAALGFPDRGLQERSDFTGFNWADVPVILVEMGFMTNPTEDRPARDERLPARAALGLCRGTLASSAAAPAACRLGLVLLVESDCVDHRRGEPRIRASPLEELALLRVPPLHDRGELGDGDNGSTRPAPRNRHDGDRGVSRDDVRQLLLALVADVVVVRDRLAGWEDAVLDRGAIGGLAGEPERRIEAQPVRPGGPTWSGLTYPYWTIVAGGPASWCAPWVAGVDAGADGTTASLPRASNAPLRQAAARLAPVDRDDLDRLLDALQGLRARLGEAERRSDPVERLGARRGSPRLRRRRRCARRRARPGRRSRRLGVRNAPPVWAPIRTSGRDDLGGERTLDGDRGLDARPSDSRTTRRSRRPSASRPRRRARRSRSRTSSSWRASSRFHLSSPSVSSSLVESTMSVNRKVRRASTRRGAPCPRRPRARAEPLEGRERPSSSTVRRMLVAPSPVRVAEEQPRSAVSYGAPTRCHRRARAQLAAIAPSQSFSASWICPARSGRSRRTPPRVGRRSCTRRRSPRARRQRGARSSGHPRRSRSRPARGAPEAEERSPMSCERARDPGDGGVDLPSRAAGARARAGARVQLVRGAVRLLGPAKSPRRRRISPIS